MTDARLSAWRRRVRRVAAIAWLAGAIAVWNGVFDAHIESGARDYIDRQQRFVQGRGPRADMDHIMDTARADGVRSAWLWALGVIAPGVALAAIGRLRSPGGSA